MVKQFNETVRGLNLKKTGKNHADYVDKDGRYDIVKYLVDMENTFHPSVMSGLDNMLLTLQLR